MLVDPSGRGSRSTDYPWAPSDEEWERTIEEVERRWGEHEYHEHSLREANPKAWHGAAGGGELLAAFSAATQAVAAARELVPRSAESCSVHAGDCELVDSRPQGQAVDDVRRMLESTARGRVSMSPIVEAILAASG